MSSWNAADLVIYVGVQAARCPPTKYVSYIFLIFIYYIKSYSRYNKEN